MLNQNLNLLSDLEPGQEGIVLIDKPSGITSHDVIYQVRRKTGIKRVGHAGTLDPLASGLLIVLIGRQFTKLQDQFLKADKIYSCTAQFGLTTDSYDITGKITQQADWQLTQQLSQQQILSAMKEFVGSIKQTVPAFSAVKIKGQKLYELARKGQADQVQLPVKTVTIKDFSLKNFYLDQSKQQLSIDFEIACSSGTYIRSLIHDLGQSLKINDQIIGATITALRRMAIDQFRVEKALKLS